MTRRFLYLIWLLGMIFLPLELHGQDIKTCADFKYQEDAQAFFDSGGGRPESWYGGMDQDNDGIACEDLPEKPLFLKTVFQAGVGIVGLAALSGAGWYIRAYRAKASSENKGAIGRIAPASMGSSVEDPRTPSVQETKAHPPEINVTVINNNSSSKFRETDLWLTPELAQQMPYKDYLRTRYWNTVRKNNISRAGGKCKDCGRSDQVLQVHHLSYEYLGREDDRYLVVLCAGCHEKRHDLPSPPNSKH